MIERVWSWWFAPVARGRIAALRTILYTFVFVDMFLTTSWVARHAFVSTDLYQPLFFGRLLSLPAPTEVIVRGTQIALLIAAAIVVSGKLPRSAGFAVAILYLAWMFIAMSYGKVDHDRVAFLVALAVLPSAGPARWGDREETEAAGWAVHSIQLAVVATYFLAAFAKLRFGGLGWVNGATLMRAVLRRGRSFVDPLQNYPWVLQMTQWFIVAFELASPVLLGKGKFARYFLVMAILFHLMTYATIKIIFLPHVMCLLAFMPLERLEPARLVARLRRPSPALR